MSIHTHETVRHDSGLPAQRCLPSAISHRIIFQLAPFKEALPFTPNDVKMFTLALEEGTKDYRDFILRRSEGNYLIDFPSVKPVRAAERIATVLFNGFGDDYANAELLEARIERAPDELDGIEMDDAWGQMDNVTPLVERIMDWKKEQLLQTEVDHRRFEVS